MCGLRFVSQGCSRDRSRPYVWMTVRTYRWMEVWLGRGVEINAQKFRFGGFSWRFAGDLVTLRKTVAVAAIRVAAASGQHLFSLYSNP